ncbi:hypothetical protein NDK50_08150 [Paraburkholderia bryophila]|uniref:hypothetical protein n=1 Tax=Paraburkholderia bryophila TaxID=420952 RepID=UPI00234AD1BD|nr:hypothetical protein [Paraburkholderia bryophila]WCM21408.1 hypothetical protein NDK50_08150 [Paraburkholderia bryophila]
MKGSIKVFMDAAKETPRLYFAPLVGAIQAVSKVSDQMVKTQRGNDGQFGKFEAKNDRQRKTR